MKVDSIANPNLPPEPTPIAVKVVDFDVSFFSMVWLLVKLSLAAIPAVIILFLVGVFLVAILGSIGNIANITGH